MKCSVHFILRLCLAISVLLFIRFRPLLILSGSMEPVLPVGSIVFVDLKYRNPQKGDIITYRLSDALITHRLIREENGLYITKGDKNTVRDLSPVAKRQIIGTVHFCIPRLGYMAFFLKNKGIAFLFIILFIHFLNNLFRKDLSL